MSVWSDEEEGSLLVVPTDIPTDSEGDHASMVGGQEPEAPTLVPEHHAMVPASFAPEAASPVEAEPEALAI